MLVNTIFPIEADLAVNTFRNLSVPTRKHISVERISILLQHKYNYFSGLTYTQKCKVTTDRIVEVVQKRLQRAGIYLTKSLIRLVLQAEEQFYVNQFAEIEDENFDLAA
ncbi:MAG: hypothetical protein ACPGJS_01530 [Flammeovirgaceae bacterium]